MSLLSTASYAKRPYHVVLCTHTPTGGGAAGCGRGDGGGDGGARRGGECLPPPVWVGATRRRVQHFVCTALHDKDTLHFVFKASAYIALNNKESAY